MMKDSIEEMYQQMIESNALADTIVGGTHARQFDDSDGEDFFTSKEIVQQQEALEKRYGASPTSPRGGTGGVIEEEAHFKRYTQKREHKYTEKEKQEIRESCVATIVHDYGEFDIYHLSDEERAKNDMLAEIRLKLVTLKRTYHQVDKYIEAMRVVMEAWEILEKHNYLHTKEEFYQLVAEGKIYSSSIIMPKLKRMDQYNLDMIIQYISNPEADASDLIPAAQEVTDSWYDQFDIEDNEDYQKYFSEYLESLTEADKENKEIEDIHDEADSYAREKIEEDEMKRLLSPDEVAFVLENAQHPPRIDVKDISPKYIKGYDRTTFGKVKKKGSKTERYKKEILHRLLNKIQKNPQLRDFNRSYDHSLLVTQSMFEPEKPFKDFMDDIRFDGSWASEDDVFLYNLAVREEVLKQHPANQGYLTYADKEVSDFIKVLEKAGVNTLELRRKMNVAADTDGTDDATVRAKRKENKKLEAAIIQRITKLNASPKFKKLTVKAEKALNKAGEDD